MVYILRRSRAFGKACIKEDKAVRTLAYVFGSLLLLDGIPAIFSPHFWVKFSERNLGGYLPKPALEDSGGVR